MIKSANKPKRQEIVIKSKIAIEESCVSRGLLEAIAQDDGTIPGDNKGAAGFDSHLYAYVFLFLVLFILFNLNYKIDDLRYSKSSPFIAFILILF